jgi:hypothetical protein
MNVARTLIAAALITTGSAAFAQAIINQASAQAGNVTPGDAAGFPITISQPGSYKLTTNLFVPANTDGVVITAANVTLDLNGFSIVGPGTCSQNSSTLLVSCTLISNNNLPGDGIKTGVESVIKNGTIKGFAKNGVSAGGGGELLERLTVAQNAQNGILQLASTGGLRIVDSFATMNIYSGAALKDSVVSGSRFMSNGQVGLAGDETTLVLDSLAKSNRDAGFVRATLSRTLSHSNAQNVLNVVPLGANMNKNQTTTY